MILCLDGVGTQEADNSVEYARVAMQYCYSLQP